MVIFKKISELQNRQINKIRNLRQEQNETFSKHGDAKADTNRNSRIMKNL